MRMPRALAICTTAMGDTLMCTPALADLASLYEVDCLVHARWRGLLLNNPNVKRVLPYRNNQAARLWLGLRLWPTRYERVLVMHANSDFLKLLPLLRYQRAVNLQGHEDPGLGLENLSRDPRLHFVEQRLTLSAWAGALGRDGPLEMHLTQKELDSAGKWLSSQGLLGRGPVVALCPGAALDYKRWPLKKFARVARELAANGTGILLVGSSGEKELLQGLRAMCPGAKGAFGLDLRLAAGILKHCELLITNDTGPMHLAMAMGTRTLAIFGPSSPHAVGPRQDIHQVFQVPLCCEPCLTKKCHDPTCLAALSVSKILAKAQEMLKGEALP